MEQQKSKPTPRRGRKSLWLIPVVLVVLSVIFTILAIAKDAPNRQELATLTIDDINFANLIDGTYTGSFIGTAGSQRDATVEVTVSNGAITNIRIIKGAIDQTGAPLDLGNGSTIYDLLESAVEKKTLQVDVISGATLTSKAHLKALENALTQAQAPQPQN